MTSILTRTSILAVKPEVTQNTPVSPTAGSDVIEIQDDVEMVSAFELQENNAIHASLAKSQSLQGIETPNGSFSAYLKASGTEGTAPQTDELLEAVFGTEEVNATEFDTVSSTTSTLTVDTGEGVNFSRGEGLLVKDATNGREIRCVKSVSGDVLTLNFELPNSPGASINLGKASFFKPANASHQSLTIWDYRGDGGLIQMISGARINEFSFEATAGELINANYGFEGLKFHKNPIEVTSSDIKIDFTDDDGTFQGVLTAQFFRDPDSLANAIASAMNATTTTEVHTVVYSDTNGKFKFTATGTLLSLLWNTGAGTADTVGDVIGFVVSSDDTGTAAGTGYEGDNALDLSFQFTASFDSSQPLVAKNNEILIGDAVDNICFEASTLSFTLTDTIRPVDSICAETGRSSSLVNERDSVVTVTAILDQFDCSKWEKFRANTALAFQFAFGEKDSSNNWIEGKSGVLYMSDASITELNNSEDDGLVAINLTITGFVNTSAEDEVFLNFL